MVNIDTVYQRVLAIANKEQRGYITPQEFNLYANQAQLDVFEQYFYDLNAFQRVPGNDLTHADMVDLIQEKIDIFEKFQQTVTMSASGVGEMPDYYRMGELYYLLSGSYYEIEKVNQNELHHYLNSPLTAPTTTRPMYVRNSGSTEVARNRAIQIYPTTITSAVTCNYIAKPSIVSWGFTIINDQALYNSSAGSTTHFELHPSEETELVVKILEQAGVSIKDPSLADFAAKEEMPNIQQEE